MADDWIGINSSHIDSLCGEYSTYTLAKALDGTNVWAHLTDETHWFILDLVQSYTIKKVRGRSKASADPIDIDIFVSDDKENWGAAVASTITTWQDDDEWVEIDTVDKVGRYIKVVINDTEDEDRELSFGGTFPLFAIFDAYGAVAAVTHEWEGSDGIALTDTLVKTPMKMLVDGFQFSDVTIKEFYKVLTDPIAFTDTLVSLKTIFRTFVDGIAFTDVVHRLFEKIFTDGIKFTDCLTKWRWLDAIRNLTKRRCAQPSVREQDAVDDGNI